MCFCLCVCVCEKRAICATTGQTTHWRSRMWPEKMPAFTLLSAQTMRVSTEPPSSWMFSVRPSSHSTNVWDIGSGMYIAGAWPRFWKCWSRKVREKKNICSWTSIWQTEGKTGLYIYVHLYVYIHTYIHTYSICMCKSVFPKNVLFCATFPTLLSPIYLNLLSS